MNNQPSVSAIVGPCALETAAKAAELVRAADRAAHEARIRYGRALDAVNAARRELRRAARAVTEEDAAVARAVAWSVEASRASKEWACR
jgi:hypothetical protein